jgi:hypothetical protein
VHERARTTISARSGGNFAFEIVFVHEQQFSREAVAALRFEIVFVHEQQFSRRTVAIGRVREQ